MKEDSKKTKTAGIKKIVKELDHEECIEKDEASASVLPSIDREGEENRS